VHTTPDLKLSEEAFPTTSTVEVTDDTEIVEAHDEPVAEADEVAPLADVTDDTEVVEADSEPLAEASAEPEPEAEAEADADSAEERADEADSEQPDSD
jgi:hypothetical protein